MRTFLLLLCPLFLWAEAYYARVEPLRVYTLSAKTAAQVASIDKAIEGRVAGREAVVTLDATVKKAELDSARIRHQNLSESYAIRQAQVARNAKISSRTRLEKENDRLALLDLQTQLAAAKENLVRLQEAYEGTRIHVPGLFVHKILVEAHAFVNVGMPLLTASDLSGSRLTLFMRPEALEGLEHKEIMVEGVLSNYRVEKIWQTADDQQISAYRVELVGPPPGDRFSQLVRIEFKPKEGNANDAQ